MDGCKGILMDRMLERCGLRELVGGWMTGCKEEVMHA